jgi:hypothetical protein
LPNLRFHVIESTTQQALEVYNSMRTPAAHSRTGERQQAEDSMELLLKRCSISAVAAAALLLAGCTQSNSPAANSGSAAANASGGRAELVTAKTAFWPMYKSAQAWSSDVEVMRIVPGDVPGFKNAAGKAAMWQATFASPSRRQYRVYSYAIATALPDIHKGTDAGLSLPWGGQTRDAMPIDLSVFTVDSDAAYQTSASDAAAWLAKNPGIELTSLDLGSTYALQAPVWYVAWGDKKSGYTALVNATTGKLYKGRQK